MEKDLRKKLGIDDWLELVKEDRNCNGAYISFGQYMYLLEKENQELKEQLEDMTLCRDIASGHRKEVQDRETILLNQQKEFIKYLEDYIEVLKSQQDSVEGLDLAEEHMLMTLEEVLSKYKEIIRDEEEDELNG